MIILVTVLSILGGLSGSFSGFLVTAKGEVFGDIYVTSNEAALFWVSIISIFLGFLAWKWNKLSGAGLLIVAIYGIYTNGLFFTIAFIFLLIAGILAFRVKPQRKQAV
ncbi:hypothetical protein F9U64_17795 [Gracilibacillus oryzae]|uniref:DUF4064 domain-containing protein n=1 Tax=Gracilibacillus oryzae TaxID=1672701 RepID=A0A7C8KQA2_9BACI|nr:hypothetical protein [Gracilibacillus oryzae]KAB8127500.1 hypothetical protein F9U64_17795 [Gracilibacillus oryzae]